MQNYVKKKPYNGNAPNFTERNKWKKTTNDKNYEETQITMTIELKN